MTTTMMKKSVICMCLLLLLLLAISRADSSINSCTRLCGNVDIPFPFGIESDCFLPGFHVVCNNSKLYSGGIQILNINPDKSHAHILQKISLVDPQNNNNSTTGVHISTAMNLTGSPFRFPESRNIFAAFGCNVIAFFNTSIPGKISDTGYERHSCAALCNDVNYIHLNGTCSGADGCCQITNIPREMQQLTSYLILDFAGFSGGLSSQNSSFLFSTLVSRSFFNSSSDLSGRDLFELFQGQVPVSVDWTITNASCHEAKLNPTAYACRSQNSECYEPYSSFKGYTCSCSEYYKGNPYKKDGCSGNIFLIISASVGGCVLILFTVLVLLRILKKRNLQNRKRKFYRRNLDLLKMEQSSTDEIVTERMKIYELDELEKATNNFDKTRVVGGGGHGKVYKGILSDQRVVAIKKPKITSESELGQFINEVFILSQTNHRNVVKFMGCCLQTEVPLLVFEFISGGTLSDHLLNHEQFSPLSFEDRLRIAYEVARALSYIHSEASVTIFHRDVKSSNILLDERNTAKLADFGASRAVTCDKNSVTTIVQGTYGYLDPEYHQTGRLTDKSDVYSFGVILAELLTGKTAIPYQKNNEVRHLVMDFVGSLKGNSLIEILDPLVLEEAKDEILEKIARLIERCLKMNGNERPTMKGVEEELEAMREKKLKVDPDDPDGLRGTASIYTTFDLGVDSLGGISSFDTCFGIDVNSL
ncbi:hypothetical protein ZIOFF_026041 [Zingiber officinale]|uniref:Protein kinase domain-containing protein n=1 Tax=Zingiber officinale TaxID=94328 RepID=A0A8J5LHN1_ZINOF|nr:hypothetical protein ZIOFF_026041 [Zingiber officinale]